ncbi:unnamed protein product [Caenorhabditis angaria]|uniref:Uncharacterized protein n=1 Tax=Caenorhabditis angaria TaxID=860376 RepID=A0A9P1ILL8_9PELO|nr:unnamed protein product [Caenorhabditis angaria]
MVFVPILLTLCKGGKKSNQSTTNCSATSLSLAQGQPQQQQQQQQQQVLTPKSSFILESEDVEKKKREEREKLEKEKEKKKKEEEEKGGKASRRSEKGGEGEDDDKYDEYGNIQQNEPKHEKTVRIELNDDPSKTNSTRTQEGLKVKDRLSDIGLFETKEVSEMEKKAAKEPPKKARTMSPTPKKPDDDKLDVTQEYCPEVE